MTDKSKGKKSARLLQERYGCSYQHALNLVRNHGFEVAEARLKIEGNKRVMTMDDVKRLRVGEKPSHLARFEKAFNHGYSTVLDAPCPDCGLQAGAHCQGDFS